MERLQRGELHAVGLHLNIVFIRRLLNRQEADQLTSVSADVDCNMCVITQIAGR